MAFPQTGVVMEELLTTKQAARALGVSEAFLERDRWAGARIRFVRIGQRAVRYRPEDLKAYIEARTEQANAGIT